MKSVFVIILLCISCTLTAQTFEQAKLLGESGDGKTVKLIWFLKSWNVATIGFDIKRRVINQQQKGDWIKVNARAIIPEINITKTLSNVEPDNAEQKRLRDKLATLINRKITKEIPAQSYLQKLSADPNALKGVAYTIALDYDMALINGFALVDRNIPAATTYEYGLFLITNTLDSNPISSFIWNYGSKVDLSVPVIFFVKPTTANNKIQLLWKTDAEKLKAISFAGFNIYKETNGDWQKLNTTPVNTNNINKEFTFFDTTANAQVTTKYAVSLQTIFGNEGQKKEYTYNPNEYKAVELEELKTLGENLKNNTLLQWNFPKEYEKYITGFFVEKANLPEGYKKVSQLLNTSDRSYTDTSFSPPALYVQYKVIATYKDSTTVNSNERLYYYFPILKSPKPQNTQAKLVTEDNKLFVTLSWQKPKEDTLTTGYVLYSGNSAEQNGKLFLEASLPVIKDNHYQYEIVNEQAAQYQFCVVPINRYSTEGTPSDTVKIQTPTRSLPTPVIYPYSLDSNVVTLNWKYANLPGIKGFRIYQNGNLVADENDLKKDARQFITPQLKYGATYQFTIKAVSIYGFESELSIPREISIAIRNKKQ